jgi:hypothetical protein
VSSRRGGRGPDRGEPDEQGLEKRRFKDHFSGHAADYSRYRPVYPHALFEYLASIAPARERAWDCATGNGQAARVLAELFTEVVATDASSEQLALAPTHPRVAYRREPAEATSLEAASCDLVTVAQALHWLRWDEFYAEVRRTARPGAILAAWTYPLMRVDDRIDDILRTFHDETVGEYWPPERVLVDSGYAGIPFPFGELEAPAFEMCCEWTAAQALGYVETWSAVRRFRRARGRDPLAEVASDLEAAWGRGPRAVRWPLTLLIGLVC